MKFFWMIDFGIRRKVWILKMISLMNFKTDEMHRLIRLKTNKKFRWIFFQEKI